MTATEAPKPITSAKDPRFAPTLYAHVGQAESWTLEYYQRNGGYEGVKRAFDEKGIVIPFPQMDVHVQS